MRETQKINMRMPINKYGGHIKMGHLYFRSRVVYIFPYRRITLQGKPWKGNHDHADKPLLSIDTIFHQINPCRVEFQQEFDAPSIY